MKLSLSPRVALKDPEMQRELREHARQVNDLSEGRGIAKYNAMAAVPTTGTYAQNDTIANSAITELGAPGAKYIVKEFVCIVGGTPGTWVQARCLTGN